MDPETLNDQLKHLEILKSMAVKELPNEVKPVTHQLLISPPEKSGISPRSFTLSAMSGNESDDWCSMQMMRINRRVQQARLANELVMEMHDAQGKIYRDNLIEDAVLDCNQAGDLLVYRALGLCNSKDDTDPVIYRQIRQDTEFVRSLSTDQKDEILDIQNTLNAMQLFHAVLLMDQKKALSNQVEIAEMKNELFTQQMNAR